MWYLGDSKLCVLCVLGIPNFHGEMFTGIHV